MRRSAHTASEPEDDIFGRPDDHQGEHANMSAEDYALTTAGTRSLAEHLLAVSERRQPVFWIALAVAAMVHAAALVGIMRSAPHRVGDPNGAADAIDVEIIDEAALHKKMGLPDPTESVAATPPSASTPPPAEQPQAEPEQQPEQQTEQPPPPQEAPAAEATPQQEAPKPAPEVPAEEAAPALPSPAPEKETPKEAKKSEPEPAPKPAPKAEAEAKPKPKVEPKPKVPKTLDLSVPLNLDGEPSSGSSPQNSGVSRPPGITRSGENDRFGRDVIRALKRTMPAPMGIRGRVTIKIVLNKRGNVASVTLVQSGGNRSLDGEVLFAAGQTSFPFPPKGATEVDRTFLVTYIYR